MGRCFVLEDGLEVLNGVFGVFLLVVDDVFKAVELAIDFLDDLAFQRFLVDEGGLHARARFHRGLDLLEDGLETLDLLQGSLLHGLSLLVVDVLLLEVAVVTK